MEKATQTFILGITPILALVLLIAGLAPGKLGNYGKNTKSRQLASAPSAILADTIPEEFDQPLGAPRFTPYDPSPFPEEEASRKVIPEAAIEVDTAFTQVREIEKDYTGFKIEITSSEEPLPDSHDIFFQHGNLSMQMLPDSTYSYLLGDFEKVDQASIFMQDFLLQRYPKAQVVEFNAGERIY